MTTLDQVKLLEEKVEGAVAKLQQLQAENDALRKQCAELTNALSSKTEQLSTFNSDKNQIEDGLKKALDRLDFIENSVLRSNEVKTETPKVIINDQVATSTFTVQKATDNVAPTPVSKPISEQTQTPSSIQITPGVSKISEEQINKTVNSQNITNENFNTMNTVPTYSDSSAEPVISEDIEENNIESIDDNDQDALGFDIF